MRKMRLYVLGALTEQLVAWFLHDIIPKNIMERTKRSIDVPGIIYFLIRIIYDACTALYFKSYLRLRETIFRTSLVFGKIKRQD